MGHAREPTTEGTDPNSDVGLMERRHSSTGAAVPSPQRQGPAFRGRGFTDPGGRGEVWG